MKINERLITRQFIDQVLKEDFHVVQDKYVDAPVLQVQTASEDHSSSSPLETDMYGVVTKDSLYDHFDLDNDHKVTIQDYVDHTKFHCAHPETLDHYNTLRQQSHQIVPCQQSYDSCSQHFMSNPDLIKDILSPMLVTTGVDCHESAVTGLIDVIRCLKEKGHF